MSYLDWKYERANPRPEVEEPDDGDLAYDEMREERLETDNA